VIVEDGSTDTSANEWYAAVARATGSMRQASLVHASNVHELRAYNLGAKAAAAINHTEIRVFCFLQVPFHLSIYILISIYIYVHASNVHELRAYNLGAKAAAAINHTEIGVFCFLQVPFYLSIYKYR